MLVFLVLTHIFFNEPGSLFLHVGIDIVYHALVCRFLCNVLICWRFLDELFFFGFVFLFSLDDFKFRKLWLLLFIVSGLGYILRLFLNLFLSFFLFFLHLLFLYHIFLSSLLRLIRNFHSFLSSHWLFLLFSLTTILLHLNNIPKMLPIHNLQSLEILLVQFPLILTQNSLECIIDFL